MDREFTLQLGIPKKYPKRWTNRYSYSCHDSDGLEDCQCVTQGYGAGIEECVFHGRPTEPLAFYLPPYFDVQQQEQSPLYNMLPKEIRDMIWEFALADDGAPSPDSDNVFRRVRGATADFPKVDSACALLQTCKAVYLETYRLPMQVNGYLSYRLDHYAFKPCPSRPNLERIAPWQYALIQRLDLSLMQTSLEGGDLEKELDTWGPTLRHSGAYVAPRFYSVTRPEHRPEGQIGAHNFALTLPSEKAADVIKDGDKVTLGRYEFQTVETDDPEHPTGRIMVTGRYTARAMVARPLTHLTLRMSHTDWWTWTDVPTTTDSDEQLALDPAYGGIEPRPLVTDMLALAAKRRANQHPAYSKTWGAAIGRLPDLKTLELILETFSLKKHQLDTVVECAKLWKFPLKDTPFELVYDGNVKSMKWTRVAEQDSGGSAADDEARSEAMGLDDQSEAHNSHQAATFNEQSETTFSPLETYSPPAATHTSQDRERFGDAQNEEEPVNGESSRVEGDFMSLHESPRSPQWVPAPPGWSPQEDPWTPGLSPISVMYNPTSPAYSPNNYMPYFRDEPWMRDANEIEVRIIRFRRRRIV